MVTDPLSVVLRNGVSMPLLGLGTSHSGGYSHPAVVHALKDCGYRLIDTAKRYGNEQYLQKAIEESGVPREKIFLTTKLWPSDYGRHKTREAFDGSRRRLGTDYIDLYLMHWPQCPSSCSNTKQLREDTWREMERLYDEGLLKAIGVSNFEMCHLEEMEEYVSVVPHVNQVEFHPYHHNQELLEYCTEKSIQLEGYCPLAKGTVLSEPAVLSVANQVQRTPAQVVVRWSIQKGVVTIPKSTKLARVRENCAVFDFSLSAQDVTSLDALHDGRRCVDVTQIQGKIDSTALDGYKLNDTTKRQQDVISRCAQATLLEMDSSKLLIT